MVGVLLVGSALAAPNNETNQKRLDSTVRYLQDVQNPDGGFGGNANEESNQDFSAWVALALAAAGINPQDQSKEEGSPSVYTYLTEHAKQALPRELCQPIICTTAFERELLVADASGTSPHSFGAFDLVTELLARKLPDSSFPYVPGGKGEVNDTAFAILSLSAVEEPAAQEALGPAAKWLIGQQNEDGGWAWHNKGSPSEADLTGAALQALVAARIAGPEVTEAETKALKFLHKIQDPDGGFPEFATEHESNVASTAWATQGLWALKENPETWTQNQGLEPLDYLESMQQEDGHIRYRASEEANGVWMTAYTAPAFAGVSWPIPAPPRKLPSDPTSGSGSNTPSSGTGEPGDGGESNQPGGGVIAGGGGDGAPLFSRPQPQSKGQTPGGVRQLSVHHAKTAAKHRRNPGAPRKTPVPTITAETSPENGGEHGKTGTGTAARGTGTGASAARKGTGSRSTVSGLGGGLPATGGDSPQPGGEVVKGVVIGSPSDPQNGAVTKAGAPGLHSAGAGGNETSWLAVAIGVLIALLILAGSQLERRRPQAIL